jgi:hypothetical protein
VQNESVLAGGFARMHTLALRHISQGAAAPVERSTLLEDLRQSMVRQNSCCTRSPVPAARYA